MKVFVILLFCVFTSSFAYAEETSSTTTSSVIEFPIDTQSSTADFKRISVSEAVVAPSPNKSLYFFMPRPEATAVNLTYATSSKKTSDNGDLGRENSEFKVSNYDFKLMYSFDETAMAFLTTGFQSSETTRANDSTRYRVSNGMTDIFIGGQRLSKGEKTNFIYGGTLGIPTEPRAEVNYNLANSEGNSTSGNVSLNPYLGTETNFAGGVAGLGAGAHFVIYQQRRAPDGGVYDSWMGEKDYVWNPIYDVNFYYEFNVAKPVKLGVTAGLTRNEHEKRTGDGWINERQAKVYGEGRIYEEIFVTGSLGALTQDYGHLETLTTAQIGLKKLL